MQAGGFFANQALFFLKGKHVVKENSVFDGFIIKCGSCASNFMATAEEIARLFEKTLSTTLNWFPALQENSQKRCEKLKSFKCFYWVI